MTVTCYNKERFPYECFCRGGPAARREALPHVAMHDGRRLHTAHNRAKTLTPSSGRVRLPMRLFDQRPALDDDPSAMRGDVYDQGRARRPRGGHRAAVEVPDRRGLTQCLQAIMAALQAGESVELRGFGRFQLRHRPPRAGRNPRTGEPIPIPAKAVPTFTAGKAFQERVHSSAAPAGGAV